MNTVMTDPCHYLDWPIYGLSEAEKQSLLAQELASLTDFHRSHCPDYARLLKGRGNTAPQEAVLAKIPFLPVRLFKEYELSSISGEKVFKILTSSGTTQQKLSRIVLDSDTAKAQTTALVRILQNYLGKSRLPMLIIDHPGVIKDRHSFSARGAGILGLSTFGRDHTYALSDEDMQPNLKAIHAFMEKHRNERIFIFGFTFMVWKHFLQALEHCPDKPHFSEAILIHSGGWKKLQDEAIDNDAFKANLRKVFNIGAVHNFYGMVEQTGSISMECEYGRLHTPAFADVLIRDAHDWSLSPIGKRGLIQVLSTLPRSYPGHSLLTEDLGELLGVDDCPCGRLGQTFIVHGRIARAEIRGCSDTHAQQFSGKNL